MRLVRLLYKITPGFIRSLWRRGKLQYLKITGGAIICPIVKNPNDVFIKVYKVKDNTWEDTYYPECYGHCKEQHLVVFSPEEYYFKIPKGTVCNNSDVVIGQQGAYWDKYNDEEFLTWAKPDDQNVLRYDNKNITIRKYKKHETLDGNVVSLLGVWAKHWGHCMYQFLPKLFTAGEAGLLNDKVTVLIPESEDKTIMEIIQNFLINYPKVTLLFAKDEVDYHCETLFFMPTSGSNFNDPLFRLDYPYFISRHVLDKTKKYVIDPIIDKVKNNEPKYDKVFLPRRGRRTATNNAEIEQFFKEQGFHEIEGADLTLEEKADIFYHAKEVVGIYGSGLLNLMFSNKARCMVLINYRMSTDTSLYLQIRDYVSTLINVTGQDVNSEYHSDTYFPLEKIKRVYFDSIKTEE